MSDSRDNKNYGDFRAPTSAESESTQNVSSSLPSAASRRPWTPNPIPFLFLALASPLIGYALWPFYSAIRLADSREAAERFTPHFEPERKTAADENERRRYLTRPQRVDAAPYAATQEEVKRWTSASQPSLRLRSDAADWSVDGETAAARKAGTRQTLTLYGDHPNDDVELAFRWIPAGTFEFGSRFDELKRDENDVFPARRETVERGFWLLETETTERMRLRVERGKYAPNPAGLLTLGEKRLDEPLLRYELRALLYAFPTMKIHWYDALRFCRRLNELDGKPAGLKFRLPTEVEWEYACRAGTTTAHNVGEELRAVDASFKLDASSAFDEFPFPTNVASFPPNAWGLYDMSGNAAELCAPALDAPLVFPSEKELRLAEYYDSLAWVARGGSYESDKSDCRSASRVAPSLLPDDVVGFRLALVPDDETPSYNENADLSPTDDAKSSETSEEPPIRD